MNTTKKTARIVGVLFIIGTVAGVLSVVSIIDDPDYLIKVSANENQVIIGAFFQFIMAVAYVGIAISLYPILRKYYEGLSLGFVSFRIIAGVLSKPGRAAPVAGQPGRRRKPVIHQYVSPSPAS